LGLPRRSAVKAGEAPLPLTIKHHFRYRFAQFKLITHLPNLRCLLCQACCESLSFLLLLRDLRLEVLLFVPQWLLENPSVVARAWIESPSVATQQ